MIVKVQTSISTTFPAPQVLIYNEDRSFMYTGGINVDMQETMRCGCGEGAAGERLLPRVSCSDCGGKGTRLKAYFEAKVTKYGVEIGDEVEAQDW